MANHLHEQIIDLVSGRNFIITIDKNNSDTEMIVKETWFFIDC